MELWETSAKIKMPAVLTDREAYVAQYLGIIIANSVDEDEKRLLMRLPGPVLAALAKGVSKILQYGGDIGRVLEDMERGEKSWYRRLMGWE